MCPKCHSSWKSFWWVCKVFLDVWKKVENKMDLLYWLIPCYYLENCDNIAEPFFHFDQHGMSTVFYVQIGFVRYISGIEWEQKTKYFHVNPQKII